MRYLVAGLGNPGSEYDGTRHNVGFAVADRAARRLGAEISRSGFRSLYGEAFHSGEKLLIMKPQTFMNSSGEAIREAARFYGIPPSRAIVVHDELDLPLGTLRISEGGGAAGHNGVRSVMASLGSADFVRVRVGVGKPPGKKDGRRHVLSRFSKDERDAAEEMTERACAAALAVVSDGAAEAMNRFNGAD